MASVRISDFAVEKSAGVSPEEIDGALVSFDEAVSITGSDEGGLILQTVSIQNLRILRISKTGIAYHAWVVGVERMGEYTQKDQS